MTVPDTKYIKMRMPKGQAALGIRIPGGWYTHVANGPEAQINMLFEELTNGTQSNSARSD